MAESNQDLAFDRSKYDHYNEEKLSYKSFPGINEPLIREISKQKKEPEWMLNKRIEALNYFISMEIPNWGPSLSSLDIEKIHLFIRPDAKNNSRSWDEVPEDIKKTFEILGIPDAERKFLAGVGAQYESEVIYHNLKEEWERQGVIFCDCDYALQNYSELFKNYFMTSCVPINLHKFSALHAAVWSGGTFIYIPKDVKVEFPLQAYFRMNSSSAGQFEHTLIIADEGSEFHYIEACSAPRYEESSLHAGCVEIHALKNSKVKYTSIENWSKNTFNLNTKRAIAHENATIEFINGNFGSKVTMLYPNLVLLGNNSKANYIGIAFSGKDQNQDTGTKIIHIGRNTYSTTLSKSISKDGGISSFRGLLSIKKSAENSKANIMCDALLLDSVSKSNTYPFFDINNNSSTTTHEASVGKISEEKIFYLQSRGLSKEDAIQFIVLGFLDPISKELPLEYAVELNKLVQLEMRGSLG